MRDIQRIKAEIKLLELSYGAENVIWAADYSWTMVKNWKLPPKYNLERADILILVPQKYGYGESYRDFFISQGLRIRQNGDWTTFPHYFDKFPYSTLPYSTMSDELKSELQRNKWAYACVHPKYWTTLDNIVTFLNQVYTFLCDPFRDWDKK
jgi:hypothetical protein